MNPIDVDAVAELAGKIIKVPATEENPSVEDDLRAWWMITAESDIHRTLPKIEEYGTKDLIAVGQALSLSRDIRMSPAQAGMYGCLFYALGKITRAVAALDRGELPSEDTLFDLSVYAMMARSYQDRGKL